MSNLEKGFGLKGAVGTAFEGLAKLFSEAARWAGKAIKVIDQAEPVQHSEKNIARLLRSMEMHGAVIEPILGESAGQKIIIGYRIVGAQAPLSEDSRDLVLALLEKGLIESVATTNHYKITSNGRKYWASIYDSSPDLQRQIGTLVEM